MSFPEFSSAHSLLRWALEDTLEFDSETERFLLGNPYTEIRDVDPETGDIIVKLRVAPAPDKLCKLASHAVWDLKHSLDHATRAAVLVLTGDDPGDLHFPIGNHPNDLRAKLEKIPDRKTTPRYPVELHPFFWGLELYPTGDRYAGGSDELCAFSKIANVTKHAVALTTGARARLANAVGQGGIRKIFEDKWDGANNELTIGHFRAGADAKMQFDIAAFVCFGDVPLFAPHPAGHVLEQVGKAIETIIDLMEAEVARLTARMG